MADNALGMSWDDPEPPEEFGPPQPGPSAMDQYLAGKKFLAADPNSEYADILPLARTKGSNKLRLALPSGMRQFANDLLDVLSTPDTGVSPDPAAATNMMLGLAGSGMGVPRPAGSFGTFGNAGKIYKAALAAGHTTAEAELLASKVLKLSDKPKPYPNTLASQFSHNIDMGNSPERALAHAKTKWPNDLEFYKQSAAANLDEHGYHIDDLPLPEATPPAALHPVDHDPFAVPEPTGVPTYGPGSATSFRDRPALESVPSGFDVGETGRRISQTSWREAQGDHLNGSEWAAHDRDIARYISALDQPLTEEELAAIHHYQGGSREINDVFRRGGTQYRNHAEALHNLLMNSELPSDLLVHRGLIVRDYSNAFSRPLFGAPPKEGDIIGSKGFASASLKPGPAEPFMGGPDSARDRYMFSIALPKGSRALPVYTGVGDSALDLERELLLPPGQKYRVRGVDTYKGRAEDLNPGERSPYHVALEAIPHGSVAELDNALREGRGLYNTQDTVSHPFGKKGQPSKPHDVYAYLAGMLGLAGGSAALIPVDHDPFEGTQ